MKYPDPPAMDLRGGELYVSVSGGPEIPAPKNRGRKHDGGVESQGGMKMRKLCAVAAIGAMFAFPAWAQKSNADDAAAANNDTAAGNASSTTSAGESRLMGSLRS